MSFISNCSFLSYDQKWITPKLAESHLFFPSLNTTYDENVFSASGLNEFLSEISCPLAKAAYLKGACFRVFFDSVQC